MPGSFVVWGPEQQEAFDRDGHVTLKAALGPEQAERMARAVWNFVERRTDIREDDPSTWPDERLGTSFKKLKRHPSFRAVLDSPTTRSALDGIFGEGRWAPSGSGAQILFSFPDSSPDEWRVPSKLWHMDTSFHRQVSPPRAVKLFSVAEPLPPRGGATMVLAGTPNLQAAYACRVPEDERRGNGQMWRRFICRGGDDWLARFAADRGEPDRNDVLSTPRDVDGQRIELRELGGEPGDVHVTHVNLFHSASSNANDRPRMLIAHLVAPTESEREP